MEYFRVSFYQRLKPLADSLNLLIQPRYPQAVEHDEYLHAEVTKKSYYDKYFDAKNYKSENEEQICQSDKSSQVSDYEQQVKLLLKQKQEKKSKPPVGIYTVSFSKYESKKLILKICFEFTTKKTEYPEYLQYSDDPTLFANTIANGENCDNNEQKCKKSIPISSYPNNIELSIQVESKGHLKYFFRTRNASGVSNTRSFQYYLNIDSQLNMVKNGNLLMIGESKVLIPQQRSIKDGEFTHIKLAVSDFCLSSTQAIISDSNGSSADWGLEKAQNQQDKVIDANQYYNIVSPKMVIQPPALRLDKIHNIIQVTCGRGYGMLLDAYGTVWTYGSNNCGQLGTKDLVATGETVQLNFFKQRNIFITQVKASQYLASFAIDSTGTLYKWGANQFNSTAYPILDRFGTVMNYSSENQFQQQWTPLPVKKHFKTEKIVQVQCGNEFYLMLNNLGTLYGWGQCRNLGKGILKDGKDQEIYNICCDIEIMNKIKKLSVGNDHVVVVTQEGKIFGWGNMKYVSNKQIEFSYLPIQLTEEYGEIQIGDALACGATYTCLFKQKQKKLRLFGQIVKFTKKSFVVEKEVRKIQCSQDIIALLVQKQIK